MSMSGTIADVSDVCMQICAGIDIVIIGLDLLWMIWYSNSYLEMFVYDVPFKWIQPLSEGLKKGLKIWFLTILWGVGWFGPGKNQTQN